MTSADIQVQPSPAFVDWKPAPGLRNRHVQSLLASVKLRRPLARRRARAALEVAEDWILDAGDGRKLHGVYSPQKDPGAPLAVLVHGWEGCADSLYMLSLSGYLYARGWQLFRLHLRDHGPSHHLNPELFHANRLDEVVEALKDLQARVEVPHWDMVGFSLGGNFTLRTALAAPEAGLKLRRAIAVSPVLEPIHTLYALEEGLALYRAYFRKKWLRSVRKKAACHPGSVDVEAFVRRHTLTAMTEHFVAEHTPYDDAETYFADYAVTGDRLARLKVPTTLLMAEDDPVIPAQDLVRVHANPCLKVVRTRYGGHCGFIEDYRLNAWVDRFVAETLKQEGA
ncbi:MAG: alpha/beta fold hydrolase [Gammaproteobacteria bacterium]|nr:MAG: alpha/beta fold hydrolase [Gammaproteobacteria bacterium]